jgi:glycerol-3-phosphate dehydrogenase
LGEAGVPPVSDKVARRLWAYSDAQITYPERLVIDFLADARQVAQEKGIDFRILTYSRATLRGATVEIEPVDGQAGAATTLEPVAIINATGAWVDATLAKLPVPSRRLMGGTKGTHFVTYHPRLAELLKGHGVYTEARDGRPVFLLPFGEGTLVGTTDLPFEGDPATAVATEQELEYLLAVVADVFPDARVTRRDIVMHQCGVRPLPYVDAKTPAAITRRHQLVWNDASSVPLVSLVGGKLTTCRSLAEETAAAILDRLGRSVGANSRERIVPSTEVDAELFAHGTARRPFPTKAIRTAVKTEWAIRLEDVVERRLMLHFSPHLSRDMLVAIAAELVEQGKLAAAESPLAINRCATRLREHFGIQLTTDN